MKIEVFDTKHCAVAYRCEADGDPLAPKNIRISSDIDDHVRDAFQAKMSAWYAGTSQHVRETLHCEDTDGIYIQLVCAYNAAENDRYIVSNDLPEYPEQRIPDVDYRKFIQDPDREL